jgi:hypothetical protein
MGPGFRVFITDNLIPFAVSFEAEMIADIRTRYVVDEDDPVDFCGGSRQWKLRLEELIPAGNGESADPVEPFELRVETDAVIENYYYCKWTSIQRSFTREGLRKIRKGIAMAREVEV